MFETFGPRLGITEDENDFACTRGAGRRSTRSTRDWRTRAAPSSRRSRPRTASPSCMIGRPYHSDPGLNHGIPEEFQVLGYPILSVRSIPKRSRSTSTATTRTSSSKGRCKSGPRAQPRVAGELLGQQRAEGVGGELRRAPPERGRARPVVASSAATTRRPTGSSTRIIETSKTPYAALHDIDANKPSGSHQDPREDLRPRAEAPRGAPAGRAQAQGRARARARPEAPRAARRSSTEQLAARQPERPRASRRRSRSSRERIARLRGAPGAARAGRAARRASSSSARRPPTGVVPVTRTITRARPVDARPHAQSRPNRSERQP